MDKKTILEALQCIPAAEVDYKDWVRIGMALKAEGLDWRDWDDWSASDRRYKPGECYHKWNGFSVSGDVSGRTILYLASQYGWEPYRDVEGLKFTTVLKAFKATEDPVDTLLAGPTKSPVEDLTEFIETVFSYGDIIPYAVHAHKNKDGRWGPDRAQFVDYDKILVDAETYDNVRCVIGRYRDEAGAWIGLNPVDGKGFTKNNVLNFNYVLIESDNLSIKEQYKQYVRLKLPIAALVHSGGKSLHAVVHVDAENLEQYKKRVNFIYSYLRGQGVDIDEANKNPNRWMRLPGATRGDGRQWLVCTGIGCYDYEEWVEYIADTGC